jgi:hypothetical protein
MFIFKFKTAHQTTCIFFHGAKMGLVPTKKKSAKKYCQAQVRRHIMAMNVHANSASSAPFVSSVQSP